MTKLVSTLVQVGAVFGLLWAVAHLMLALEYIASGGVHRP
jgi:hypothetical protein